MKKIVSWDLGGTKCAAGVVEYNPTTQDFTCKQQFSIKLSEASSLEDLVKRIEAGLNFKITDADAICIGAAGHYDGQSLIYEGVYPYAMNFAQLAKSLHWPPYAVVHDYAPVVCATFTSYMQQAENVKRLNTSAIDPYGRRVALGLGTGLGLKDGVLFKDGQFWLGKNEAGHIGITTPPDADQEHLKRHHELMRFLQSDSPITFEKIISGPGIVRLHDFFHPGHEKITPEHVGEKMFNGHAEEILNTFAWYIGLFVGTVQLLFMPEGGVWITGGVALRHLSVFDRDDFFAGIKASPAYLAQREHYPLGVLCNPEHVLVGGGYYAVNRLL